MAVMLHRYPCTVGGLRPQTHFRKAVEQLPGGNDSGQ